MPEVTLYTDTEEPRWTGALPDISALSEKVKDAVFDYVAENAEIKVLSAGKPLTVSLCLSNDDTVHELNKNYRGLDRPTNVLTFANLDYDGFEAENDVFGDIDLGSIIIAYETMCREAEAESITLHDHYCHLLAHGFLHILGFDHIKDDDAARMEGFEKAILHNLGIADPYAGEE